MSSEEPNTSPGEPKPNIKHGQEGDQSGNIRVIQDETVAPDTILYNPDGTPQQTLITTPTGIENKIGRGDDITEAEALRVARMEAARKKK